MSKNRLKIDVLEGGGSVFAKFSHRTVGDSFRTKKQDAQLSQRDRAAGCVIVLPKSRRLELGDNILRTV